jgi:MFS family permease
VARLGDRLLPPLRALREVSGQPDLRRLLLAFVGFNVAEWATWIAMLVFAYRAGGVAATGLVAAIQLIPAAAAAPFAGVLGDRVPRERALLVGYLVQAAVMGATGAAMLASAPTQLVYALAAASATSIVVTRPVQGALLPSLAHSPEQLTAVNSSASMIEGVSTFLGPVLAGLVIGGWDPGWVFVGAAVWLLASAFPVALIHAHGVVVESSGGGIVRDALLGFRSIARRPAPRLLLGLGAAQTVGWGALDVLIVVLCLRVLAMDQSGVGYLNGAFGIGGLAGGIATLALVGRARLAPAIVLGIGVWGTPLALTAFVSEPVVAGVLLAFAGLGHALLDVSSRTQLQRVVPDELLSRILGVQEAARMGGLAIGCLLAPALVAGLGSRGALVVVGAALPVLGACSWRGLTRADDEARAPIREIALLRGLPMFAPLSLVGVERLAANLQPLEVPAGTVVIREGDPGDRFFFVEEGELAVTIEGRTISTLGPGDGFGEIALLRDEPRMATVSAITSARVFTLERDVFLEVVTGHPASLAASDDMIARRLRNR